MIKHGEITAFIAESCPATGMQEDLCAITCAITEACLAIAPLVQSCTFSGNDRATGTTNIQGEAQKKLDNLANDLFLAHCSALPHIAALVSEEVDDIIWLTSEPCTGDYAICFDPLDGSSNLDINMPVGSIFSIVRLGTQTGTGGMLTGLEPGSRQVCAGYVVYGPSIALVLTFGRGTRIFTYHPTKGTSSSPIPMSQFRRKQAHSRCRHRATASGTSRSSVTLTNA